MSLILILGIGAVLVGTIVALVVGAGASTAQVAHQKHVENKLNNNLDDTRQIWEQRAREIGLNKNESIRVLWYHDTDFTWGAYTYMWLDRQNKRICAFLTVDSVGTGKIVSSPSKWNVIYYKKEEVDDVYNRGNYCAMTLRGRPSEIYDIKYFNQISNLINELKAL